MVDPAAPAPATGADPGAPPPTERARMTGWYDPGQLANTGIEVVVSTLFGKNADRRILDAIAHRDVDVCDLSEANDLWIDYVSDTGDGFDSTYAVAHHVAQADLDLPSQSPKPHHTERGRLLVFGGDEVYPTASRLTYQQQLVAPYRAALPHTDAPCPTVLAVAGNHDWYDSLQAFSRLFASHGERWIGGWRTQQRLSYFAVKLPHDWWLIGTDLQLDSDIDQPQLEYFRGVAQQMPEDARVILCTAEPHWIYEARYRDVDPTISDKLLRFLEERVLGRRIELYLSGDLHHYRRHAHPDGRQKITAGGGGAFLHPTHSDVAQVAELPGGFVHAASFPTPQQSRRLAWRNLLFPFINPKFGIATALVYTVLAWAVKVDVAPFDTAQWREAFGAVVSGLLNSQIAVFWGLALFGGFYFFTDTHSKRYKLWGGFTHGLAHLLAAFLLGWAATRISVTWMHLPFGHTRQLFVAGLLIALGGYLVGPLIMGLYLFVSLNVFGRHSNEAFSSLRCPDYKSWLRLHVEPTGALTIYPIKLERVARRWRTPDATYQGPSLLVSDDPHATPPTLIEPPIVLQPPVRVPPDAYPLGGEPARAGT
jgi:hypothetical protein